MSYSRYSSAAQHGNTSTARQSKDAAAWATAHGYRLDDTLSRHDEAVSAWTGENAETGALRALLYDVRHGLIPRGSVVYVEAFDQLRRCGIWRTTRLLQEVIDLGVSLVIGETLYDEAALDDPMLMIQLVIRAQEAKVASDEKSRRVKSAWSIKRARG